MFTLIGTRDGGSNSQEDTEENQLPAGKLESFPPTMLFLGFHSPFVIEFVCHLLREKFQPDKTKLILDF